MTTGNTQIPSRQPAKSPRASQRAHRWLAGGILAVLALAVIAGALLHAPTPAEAQSAVLISNTGQTAHSTGETPQLHHRQGGAGVHLISQRQRRRIHRDIHRNRVPHHRGHLHR